MSGIVSKNAGRASGIVGAGDITISSGGAVAIATGVIVNADGHGSAGIAATKIHDGTISNTEFGYLDGVTSGIQSQLDGISAGTIATLDDDNFTLQDDSTSTKKAQFQCSGISADTTRTFTFPDASTTLVGTGTTQTLTNKTLTSPVIDGTWTSYTTSTGKALVMGF